MLFIIQTQGTIEKKPTVLHTLHIFFFLFFFLLKKCVHTDKNDPTSQ